MTNSSRGVDDSLVEMLTNDCLREIFKRLSIRDRLAAEKVCKRWRAISVEGWSELKEWCVRELGVVNDDRIPPDDYTKLTLDELATALRRCGRYLMRASFIVHPSQSELPKIFKNFCNGLKELTFWLPGKFQNPENIEEFLKNTDDLFEGRETITTAVVKAENPERRKFIHYTVKKNEMNIKLRRNSRFPRRRALLSSKIRATMDLLHFFVNFKHL